MTPRQLTRFTDKMWQKHAHADRHGYKDVMHDDGFAAAVVEILAAGAAPSRRRPPQKEKPPRPLGSGGQ